MFEEGLTRPPNGTRTLFGCERQIDVTSITATAFLNKIPRDSLETFRGALRPGSLTNGSGISNPAVTRRRRECQLPASLVFWPCAASFRLLSPPSRPLGKSNQSARAPPQKNSSSADTAAGFRRKISPSRSPRRDTELAPHTDAKGMAKSGEHRRFGRADEPDDGTKWDQMGLFSAIRDRL